MAQEVYISYACEGHMHFGIEARMHLPGYPLACRIGFSERKRQIDSAS